jgi:hypothetical protein
VSVDVAVDRVKEFGEKAGEVLQKDKASAAAKGKKKVTRSVIAPEISVKKARRLVELISLAGISDTGVISLEGLVHAEAWKLSTSTKPSPPSVAKECSHEHRKKEWLQQTIAELEEERDAVPGVVNEDAANAAGGDEVSTGIARIGGEAREACGGNGSVDIDHGEMGIEHIECPKFYTSQPAPVSVPEWTNEQCLEFLSIAFRHAEIKGDLELHNMRLVVRNGRSGRNAAAALKGAEHEIRRNRRYCSICVKTAPFQHDMAPLTSNAECIMRVGCFYQRLRTLLMSLPNRLLSLIPESWELVVPLAFEADCWR